MTFRGTTRDAFLCGDCMHIYSQGRVRSPLCTSSVSQQVSEASVALQVPQHVASVASPVEALSAQYLEIS